MPRKKKDNPVVVGVGDNTVPKRRKTAQTKRRKKKVDTFEQDAKVMVQTESGVQEMTHEECEAYFKEKNAKEAQEAQAAEDKINELKQENAINLNLAKKIDQNNKKRKANRGKDDEMDLVSAKAASVKEMFAKVKPEQAAGMLKQWIDRGELELAARILKMQSERSQPKILAALDDNALAAELVDAIMKSSVDSDDEDMN